jgi:hypothetical protein
MPAAANLEHDFHVASGPGEYAASFEYPPEGPDEAADNGTHAGA